MSEADFWDDATKSAEIMKEVNSLKATVTRYNNLVSNYEDIEVLIDMALEENDEELASEAMTEFDHFVEAYETMRTDTLLSGEYDDNNAIITLHAGAGGTESCDWAQMLARMYQRYADKKGFTAQILDYLDGEEAGLKSVTIEISGENAYVFTTGSDPGGGAVGASICTVVSAAAFVPCAVTEI